MYTQKKSVSFLWFRVINIKVIEQSQVSSILYYTNRSYTIYQIVYVYTHLVNNIVSYLANNNYIITTNILWPTLNNRERRRSRRTRLLIYYTIANNIHDII